MKNPPSTEWLWRIMDSIKPGSPLKNSDAPASKYASKYAWAPISRRRALQAGMALLLSATAGANVVVAQRSDEIAATTGVEPDSSNVERIVAIGDIHGDFETFTALLRRSGLVGVSLDWIGGRTSLVQTGDVLDRGAGSRRALELLMRLQGEAKSAGGQVVCLIGNHEVFNLVGDLHYMSADELAVYGAEEDPRDREAALHDIETFLEARKPLLRSGYYERLFRTMRRVGVAAYYPRGYFRHRALFSPSGRYGKWLLSQPAITKLDRTLFMHGGLSPRFGGVPFRELRDRCRHDLHEYFKIVDGLRDLGVYKPALGDWVLQDMLDSERRLGIEDPQLRALADRMEVVKDGPIFASDSVVWYRGMAEEPVRKLERFVTETLKRQDVDRVVIGHTQPWEKSIRSRFGGRVVLIDTGMNQRVYHGSPEALEIRAGKSPGVLKLGR